MRTPFELFAAALLLASTPALAADAGAAPRPGPAASGAASPAGASPENPHAGVPAASAGSETPHGAASPAGASPENPHAGAPAAGATPHKRQAGGAGDMFQPPEDGSVDDAKLPIGTLDVQIADPDGKPLAGVQVTLGILFSSVAKGESRKRIVGTTNAEGIARFEGLDTGSATAYRPMVLTDGATFSNMPFRLSDKAGTRALLHVYPIESDVEKAMVVCQAMLFAEVKDDRIQIQEAFKIYNFGRTAWVPKDVVIPLPPEFTAFSTQQGMSDVGLDAVPKEGVKLHGTFGPGQQILEFRWQLPYKGEADVHFDVGVPAHTALARVLAPASKDMRLEVPGFPPPQSVADEQGQRTLLTERQMRRDEGALKSIGVDLKGLPTEGPGKLVATFLSLVAVGAGLVLGTRKTPAKDTKNERARLLAELDALEQSHAAGDVGPKTYERARRELLDALARTFAAEAPTKPAGTKKRAARP